MSTPSKHRPVLLQEVIRALDLKRGADFAKASTAKEVFVDATFGGGGHSREVKKKFQEVEIITIDRDPSVEADITGNFRDIDKLLGNSRPDAILFDLGYSSDQLLNVPGLSFQRDEPLDMRLSRKGITAAEILNNWGEETIEVILRGFGEEKRSRKIARAIVLRREKRPFETTFDLVAVVGGRRGRIHPATKVFQALRIAVNEELTSLETGLEKAYGILNPKGRLVVISFHSLEDRIVKNFAKAKLGKAEKPIIPSDEEVKENPRSRSAKLRIICKR